MFNEQKPEILNFIFISYPFGGHSGMVNTVCICKQRNLLASGSDDKTVKLWNLKNNILIKTYKYYGRVYNVVFSNQGNLLAFGGMVITQLGDYNIIWKFKGHTGSIRELIFSNDSNYLISRSDSTVKIWDINLKKESFQLNSDCDVAINNNNFIATITYKNGKVTIWNFKNQKQLCSQQVHTKASGIAFSNDQKMLVSFGSNDCMIKLWNLEQAHQKKLLLIRKFQIVTKQYCTVQFSDYSVLIIGICSLEEEIKVIDFQTGNLVKSFTPYYARNVNQLDYVPMLKDMDIIAYAKNNKILVWRQQ